MSYFDVQPLPNENAKDIKSSILIKQVKEFRQAISSEDSRKLKVLNPANHKKFFDTRFSAIKDRYPTLYHLVYEQGKEMDINRLIEMLELKEKMDKGSMTNEIASKKIGESLAKDFVYPRLNQK